MHTSGVRISFKVNSWIYLIAQAGTFLEVYSMDVIVNVDGEFLGHHLIDGRTDLRFATVLFQSHSDGLKMKRNMFFFKSSNSTSKILSLFCLSKDKCKPGIVVIPAHGQERRTVICEFQASYSETLSQKWGGDGDWMTQLVMFNFSERENATSKPIDDWFCTQIYVNGYIKMIFKKHWESVFKFKKLN